MAQLVKTVQGLAIASVKTVAGLAIASVKTVMGVDNTGGGGGTTFSDNFNRANEFPMTGNWESGMGGTDDMYLLDNALLSSGGSALARVTTAAATFTSDQAATLRVGAGKYDSGPAVRVQSNGDGYIAFFFVVASDETLRLQKITGGGTTFTTIGTDIIIGATGTVTGTDTIKVSVTGSTFTLYRNGVSVGTQSDSTTTGGQPGAVQKSQSGGDDFFGEDV